MKIKCSKIGLFSDVQIFFFVTQTTISNIIVYPFKREVTWWFVHVAVTCRFLLRHYEYAQQKARGDIAVYHHIAHECASLQQNNTSTYIPLTMTVQRSRIRVGPLLMGAYIVGTLTSRMLPDIPSLLSYSSTSPLTSSLRHHPFVPAYDDGWKDIHLFVGDRNNITIARDPKDSHRFEGSQWGQDKVVMALLNQKKGGYFVDLAANHGTLLSNTRRLEQDLDWNGLCIEPNERYWDSHRNRKCALISAVVSRTKMDHVTFRMHSGSRGPGGGMEGEAFNHKPGQVRNGFNATSFFTTTIADIFQRFSAPQVIDYLSLDVEGAELVVMQSFPFHDYVIRVLTIERPNQGLIDLLYQNGYIYLATFATKGQDEALFSHSSASLNRTILMDTRIIMPANADTHLLTIKGPNKKPMSKWG